MREGGLFLRLAWREIRANRGFAISFSLTLAVGLVGLFTIDMLKASFEAGLAVKSRSVLGADLLVNSRRRLTETELDGIARRMPQGTISRREASLLSMAQGAGESRLVELRAVDERFPFYSAAILKRQGRVDGDTSKDLAGGAAAWLPPELVLQLGINAGGAIKIGAVSYTVSDVLEDDPATASVSFNLAPRVYVGLQTLDATGLLQTGSRVSFRYLYKTPPGTDVAALSRSISGAIKSPQIRVQTHQTAIEHLTRGVLYVGDYLGLVALMGLFLSAVGCIYLARSFLDGRLQAVAILISLGASHATAFLVYLTQFIYLAAAAALAAGAAAIVLVRLAARWAGPLVGDIHVKVSFLDIGVGLAVSVGAVLLFCGPMLLRLRHVKPADLLRGQEGLLPQGMVGRLAAYLPGLAAFWLLAVWQAHSLRTGGIFIAIFLVSALLLVGIGAGSLKWLSHLDLRRLGFGGRMALRFIARQRGASLASFFAISLGALLVSLIPSVRQVLDAQLNPGESATLPGLFMFDIQDEQVGTLRDVLAKAGVPINFLSPMIRARLSKVNGAEVKTRPPDHRRTYEREDEHNDHGRARSYNISYRDGLSSSERLVSGKPFSGTYQEGKGLPELSLEQRFAKRLGGGVGIGDTLTFDVQGVPVTGRIVNLRAVRWTSFQPNFFIQFQPGVLEDAPKTFVASVAGLGLDKKISLQNNLVKALPNVSVIDIEATVKRGLELVNQIERALAIMSWVTLFAGLTVLFAIARHQTRRRLIGMTLLKVLGASTRDVAVIAAMEFAVIGFSASVLGVGLSFAGAAVLSVTVFDSPWVFAPAVPALIVLATTLLCCAMGHSQPQNDHGAPSRLVKRRLTLIAKSATGVTQLMKENGRLQQLLQILLCVLFTVPALFLPAASQSLAVSTAPVRIERIIFRGNRTAEKILRKHLSFSEGDPLSPSTLKDAKTSLWDMRRFKQVDVSSSAVPGGNAEININVADGWYLMPIPFFISGSGGRHAGLVLFESNIFRQAESVMASAASGSAGSSGALSLQREGRSLSIAVRRQAFTERKYADGAFSAGSGYVSPADNRGTSRYGTVVDSYLKTRDETALAVGLPLTRASGGWPALSTSFGWARSRLEYSDPTSAIPDDSGRQGQAFISLRTGRNASGAGAADAIGSIFGFGLADMERRLAPLPAPVFHSGAEVSYYREGAWTGSDFNYGYLLGQWRNTLTWGTHRSLSLRLSGGSGQSLPASRLLATGHETGLSGRYAREFRGDTAAGANLAYSHPFRITRRGMWQGSLFVETARAWGGAAAGSKAGAGASFWYKFWRFPLPLGVSYTYCFDDRDLQVSAALGGRF